LYAIIRSGSSRTLNETGAVSAGFNGGRWRLLSIVLASCLAVSLGFNLYTYLTDLGYFKESRVFGFEWPATQQNITEGTLRIEAFFDWQSDRLNMTVNVNDDDYYGANDYLGLVFDKNRDESFYNDPPFILYGNNLTIDQIYSYLLPDGRLGKAGVIPHRSPYHTCTFNNQTGHTFRISIPKHEINFTLPMRAHLVFYEASPVKLSEWVWVRFELK
jgi:hypothetical protein